MFSYFYESGNPSWSSRLSCQSFQPTCFSSSGSDHLNINKINYHFFSTVFVSSVPSCLCFSRPPPFSFKESDVLTKYPFYSCEVSPFFSFMFLPGDSHEDSNGASVHHYLPFLLWWIQFKLSIFIIFLSSFLMFSHDDAPLYHSSLAIQLFHCAEDILEGSSCHPRSVQPISRSYLIQAI